MVATHQFAPALGPLLLALLSSTASCADLLADPPPHFVGFAGFEDCDGCRSDDCCLTLKTPRGACGCRGATLLVPGDIRDVNDTIWGMVDWPLDDVCAEMYPGSRAATMLELTRNTIAGLPTSTFDPLHPGRWAVPGCQGMHEDEWPAQPSGRQWMCSYAGAGDYRWAFQPNASLEHVSDDGGWILDKKPAYYEGDIVGSFYCADVSRELPGLEQAICVNGGPVPTPPPPPPPPPPAPPVYTKPFIRFGNAVPSGQMVTCLIRQGSTHKSWASYAFGQFSDWEDSFSPGMGTITVLSSSGEVIAQADRLLTPVSRLR